MPVILGIVVIIATALVWKGVRGGAFTPSDQPRPAEVDQIVALVLQAEGDLLVLRAIAQKLTQAGYGAQAALVSHKANAVEAKALGMSEVQLAMSRSSMYYPGAT